MMVPTGIWGDRFNTPCQPWPQVTLSALQAFTSFPMIPPLNLALRPFLGLSCYVYHSRRTALLLKLSPSPQAGAPRCSGHTWDLPLWPLPGVPQPPLQEQHKLMFCSALPHSSLHSWGHLAL